MVQYAFEELKLHRLELRCNDSNARSIAVAERLGFRLEGRLVKADRVQEDWVDFLVYGMLEEEWFARQDQVGRPRAYTAP